jgi:hypothetical protein
LQRFIDGKTVYIGKNTLDEANSLLDINQSEDAPQLPSDKILNDIQNFFKWSGGLPHPRLRDNRGFPIRVLKLAWYQEQFAKMDRGVMLASNKIGKTMSESIDTVRTRMTPSSAGFDSLLVGQTQFMADQHLLDLKRFMLQSDTLRPFMITNPQNTGLKEEKSKMRMLYIYNPYQPEKPSRIISLGFSEALAYSWKNINRLQISDPGQITRTEQTAFFSALYSRLSNTEGQIKIEGVAGERRGYFWELCKKLFKIEDDLEDEKDFIDPERILEKEIETDAQNIINSFQTIRVNADEAVKAGVISQKWLDYAMTIMSHEEFMRIYYTVFKKPEGALFGKWAKGEHQPLGLDDT